MKGYYKYAEDVYTGKQIACRYVQLAVMRFYAFLQRDDIEFKEDTVDLNIAFFRLFKHFKNRHSGKIFVLEPWQEFIIAGIFGFYYKETGKRVVQDVYIEIARKNGKSAFAAAVSLLLLIADGVSGAEVDLVANSREQALISFEFAKKFALGLNTQSKKHIRPYRDRLFFDKTSSKMHVFASDASKLDGYGASAFLIDEYHEAKNTALRDVLQSSQADRENPLGIIITTAGFDRTGPCYTYRSICTDILEGLDATNDATDSIFCIIYTQDSEDELDDPQMWVKSNPNLGVTVQNSFLKKEISRSKTDPHSEVGIKTKNFNIWMDSQETWIPEVYIKQATHTHKLLDFYNAKEEWDVFVGIDLSATSDLTAVSYMIPRPDKLYYWIEYYLPEEALRTKPLKDLYKQWHKGGYLVLTPGNVVDYEYILADIRRKEDAGLYMARVSYDSWNATQFVIRATEEGLPMVSYAQNISSFTRPTKELERRILQGSAVFYSNPITRFCFRNVRMRIDHNGNQKPDKSQADNKIDGVIAAIEALGGYLEHEQL